MRKKVQKQMPLMPSKIDHPRADELEAISRIIDSNPFIYDLVMQDLRTSQPVTGKSGADGMSCEQVLRTAIVKVLFGFPYRYLAFHIFDSQIIRRFCNIGIADTGFKESVLNKNIKAVIAEYERLKISERMSRGRRQKVRDGYVLVGRRSPYGYRVVDKERRRPDGRIGHVRTRDFREFEPNPHNPIFTPSPDPDAWDCDGVLTPQVVAIGGVCHMVYAGLRGKEWQTGLARAPLHGAPPAG